MTLLKDINTLLSESYGENVAINIGESNPKNSCSRRSSNPDNLTKAKDVKVISSNTVLIDLGEPNIFPEQGFSVFQDATYFNVDPERIFLIH
ncbi:MAG: hypothetical protein AB4290_05575 [Spirulina sp.]